LLNAPKENVKEKKLISADKGLRGELKGKFLETLFKNRFESL